MRGIIVEGADGHGKSFFARQIGEYLGVEVDTCGPPPESGEEFLQWTRKQRTRLRRQFVVLDRHTPISSLAYCKINEPPVNESLLLLYAKITHHRACPVYVFCKTKEPRIDPNKEYKSKEYLRRVKTGGPQIVERYEKIFKILGITPIIYDWQTDSCDETLRRIKSASRSKFI